MKKLLITIIIGISLFCNGQSYLWSTNAVNIMTTNYELYCNIGTNIDGLAFSN